MHRIIAAQSKKEDWQATSPKEPILRAFVDGTDRDERVQKLIEYPYSFPCAEGGMWGHVVSGTWSDVMSSASSPLLSREEFERICAAVQPPYGL